MADRILVTGVTGFIGSHMVKELVKQNYEVYGLMRYATNRNPVLMKDFLEGATLINCDVSDYISVREALKRANPDTVVHLAALSPVRDSFEKPFPYVYTNIIGTMNIAYSILELPDFQNRKMVYASTAEVYGIQDKYPSKEDSVLNPVSPYANTKAMTDVQLRMMSRVYKLNATVMRCTNSYGRKIDTSFFVEYLVNTMLKGEKVYIGAPESLREYMYVSDHVGAYLKAIAKKGVSGEAFNASAGNAISNKDLAYKIAGMLDFDVEKIVLGKYPPNYPLRPIESDQPCIALDHTKMGKVMGWKPEVSLDSGLERTIKFWSGKLGV